LKDNGFLIYYDSVWQPLSVRLNAAAEASEKDVFELCRNRGIQVMSVFQEELPDIRMQNMVVLAKICRRRLIPGIEREHYQKAMADLMPDAMLARNRELFDKHLAA
jgi:indolepyruvate ferredoxin oxidoreductase beta subunit